jgi:hypothetical protein
MSPDGFYRPTDARAVTNHSMAAKEATSMPRHKLGRPKKLENGASRSFPFPRKLLQQIEKAALQRKISASEVVREIPEANIDAYLVESATIHRQHLPAAVAAAQQDAVLRPFFERCKQRGRLELPPHSGLTGQQVMVLMEAFDAFLELRASES